MLGRKFDDKVPCDCAFEMPTIEMASEKHSSLAREQFRRMAAALMNDEQVSDAELRELNDIKCWQGFDTNLMSHPFSIRAITLKWLSFNGPVVAGPPTAIGLRDAKGPPKHR